MYSLSLKNYFSDICTRPKTKVFCLEKQNKITSPEEKNKFIGRKTGSSE